MPWTWRRRTGWGATTWCWRCGTFPPGAVRRTTGRSGTSAWRSWVGTAYTWIRGGGRRTTAMCTSESIRGDPVRTPASACTRAGCSRSMHPIRADCPSRKCSVRRPGLRMARCRHPGTMEPSSPRRRSTGARTFGANGDFARRVGRMMHGATGIGISTRRERRMSPAFFRWRPGWTTAFPSGFRWSRTTGRSGCHRGPWSW